MVLFSIYIYCVTFYCIRKLDGHNGLSLILWSSGNVLWLNSGENLPTYLNFWDETWFFSWRQISALYFFLYTYKDNNGGHYARSTLIYSMCSECNIPHIREITFPHYNKKKGTLLCLFIIMAKLFACVFARRMDGWRWGVFVLFFSAIFIWLYIIWQRTMWLRNYEILVGCAELCVWPLERFIRNDLKPVGII